MKKLGGSVSAIIAAVVLALGTVTVFWVLQDYGPQSAIRRFHLAVAENNSVDMQQVVAQPVTSSDVQELIRGVVFLTSNGPYQIARMDRQPREVAAAAVYSLPGGQRQVLIWVVVKDHRLWRVDATRTLDLLKMRG